MSLDLVWEFRCARDFLHRCICERSEKTFQRIQQGCIGTVGIKLCACCHRLHEMQHCTQDYEHQTPLGAFSLVAQSKPCSLWLDQRAPELNEMNCLALEIAIFRRFLGLQFETMKLKLFSRDFLGKFPQSSALFQKAPNLPTSQMTLWKESMPQTKRIKTAKKPTWSLHVYLGRLAGMEFVRGSLNGFLWK
jgi:hypothetical protein